MLKPGKNLGVAKVLQQPYASLFVSITQLLPQSASLTAPSRGGLTFPEKYSKKALPRESLPFFRYALYSAVNGSSAMLRARLMATVTWR